MNSSAYHKMLMPVFWELFRDGYMISTQHFQMQVLKRLHIRVSFFEVNEFFKAMEVTGYGQFVLKNSNVNGVRFKNGYETRAFKCVLKIKSEVKP